jgi:hypothetical protein
LLNSPNGSGALVKLDPRSGQLGQPKWNEKMWSDGGSCGGAGTPSAEALHHGEPRAQKPRRRKAAKKYQISSHLDEAV